MQCQNKRNVNTVHIAALKKNEVKEKKKTNKTKKNRLKTTKTKKKKTLCEIRLSVMVYTGLFSFSMRILHIEFLGVVQCVTFLRAVMNHSGILC